MEEIQKIKEKLKIELELNKSEGYCIILNDEILFSNTLFYEHLKINKDSSFAESIPEILKEKIELFNSYQDKEDFFINPDNLILLTLLKHYNKSNNYLILITNDVFQKLFSNQDKLRKLSGFNQKNLLKINDEKTFSDTLEVIPDYVVVSDLYGTIHYVSSNIIEKIGYSKDELIGRSLIKYIHPSDRQRGINLFIDYVLTGEAKNDTQVLVLTKNGETINVEVNTKTFITSQDKLYLLNILRDVTHRIELEQKLEESEKSFKNTIFHSPLGFHLYKLNENNDLIFTGYNLAAEKILKLNHETLINKTIEEAFPSLSGTKIPEIYKRIAKSGEKYFFEQIDYKDDNIQGAFEVHIYQTHENHMAAIFLDISERKRKEEKIKRLEKEYRNIFDNAPFAIFQTSLDGKFIRINKQGADLLNYNSPEEMIKYTNSIRDEIYYRPEDRDRIVEKLRNSDGFINEYIQFKKKTGEPVDTEMYARMVRDEEGNPKYLEGFIKDITRRKKAEAELKQIYTEQQTIFDSIPAIICYKDKNGIYIRINKTGAKFLNRKVKNIIGKRTEDFFPKHVADKFLKEDLKVMNSGKPIIGIIDFLKDKDGKDLWIKTDRIPYFNESGEITGVISISFDITQQYETEEKVRNYLEYLEFLNKTALALLKQKNLDEIYNYITQGLKVLIPDSLSVVLSYDHDTQTAVLRSMNESLANLITNELMPSISIQHNNRWKISNRYIELYTKGKLTKIEDSFINISRDNLSPDIAEIIEKKINISDIYVIGICKDNILYGIVYIFPNNKLIEDYATNIEAFIYQCALAIDQKIVEEKLIQLNNELEDRVKERTKLLQNTLDDLSAEINVRKLIEKELINAKLELTKALEKEKELNELKSRFIDMISHEYRTPLTVILSSMYLIESYTESGDQSKVRKHTEKVKKSVEIMTNLIENVLTIGRGNAEKINVEKRWFEIDRLLRDTIDEVLIVDKEMHPINLVIKSDINQIFSDSRLVRQILTNIILNAVKYSEPNKSVEIEVYNDLENIEISVSDKGPGIDQEELNHIFDAFFRGKNQIGMTSGTGLGLTIVKRFTDLLGGKIIVESKIKEGTKFKLIIPSK